MGSGISRVVTGAFSGTGAAVSQRTVGFRPRRVELFNAGGLAVAMWQNNMPDASMKKQITAGTISYPTANGITPLSDGFSIGADADINASGEQVFWTAFE